MSAHGFGACSLVGVAPHALSTGRSEALSGYVVRLAGAHVVATRVFVARVFPSALCGTGLVARNLLARRRALWMNGTGQWASALSAGLGRIVGRGDLGALTMAKRCVRLRCPILPRGRLRCGSRDWQQPGQRLNSLSWA